jgi:hypothetical protein
MAAQAAPVKTKIGPFLLGALVAAAALLSLGQTRPPAMPGSVGRYQIAGDARGVFVLDTQTGMVKAVDRPNLGDPNFAPERVEVGKTFERIWPAR